MKQEMRHGAVLPNPAVVREDMAGVSPSSNVIKLLCKTVKTSTVIHKTDFTLAQLWLITL